MSENRSYLEGSLEELAVDDSQRSRSVQVMDVAPRNILRQVLIAACILQLCVPEYANLSLGQIVACLERKPKLDENEQITPVTDFDRMLEGASESMKSVAQGNLTYDLRFDAYLPGGEDKVAFLIDFEEETDAEGTEEIIFRSVEYGAFLYVSQFGVHQKSKEYKTPPARAYSIWICVQPAKYLENTVRISRFPRAEDLRVDTEDKRVLDTTKCANLLNICLLGLGDPDDEALKSMTPAQKLVLRALDTIFRSKVDVKNKMRVLRDIGLPDSATLEEATQEMGSLAAAYMREGAESERALWQAREADWQAREADWQAREASLIHMLADAVRSDVLAWRKEGATDAQVLERIEEKTGWPDKTARTVLAVIGEAQSMCEADEG